MYKINIQACGPLKTRDITKVCKRCGGSGVMDIGTMLAVFVKCDCLKNKEK